jgi:O-antigen/teichoic acid export membrane protein
MLSLNLIDKLRKYGVSRNTVYAYLSKGSTFILMFSFDVLIARILLPDKYGEWAFFYSIIKMSYWVLALGVDSATQINVARTKGNTEAQQLYISTGVRLRMISSTVAGLVFLLFAKFFTRIIDAENMYVNLSAMMQLGAILVFFYMLNEFFKFLWIGYDKFKYFFIQSFVESFCILLFCVGFVYVYTETMAVEIGYTVALLIASVLGFVLYGREKTARQATKADFANTSRDIAKLAFPIWLYYIVAMVFQGIDIVMIGIFLTSYDTAVYSLAKNLCLMASHINVAYMTSAILPLATINQDNYSAKIAYFKRVIALNTIITVFVSVVLVIFGWFLIPLFYGDMYREAANILTRLFVAYLGNSLIYPLSLFLEYQKKVIPRNICYFVSVLLYIAANYLLIPIHGVYGAVAANGISLFTNLLLMVIVVTYLIKHRKL